MKSPQHTIYIDSSNIRSVDSQQQFTASVNRRELADGLSEYDISIKFPRACSPSPILVDWFVPLIDMAGKWHPTIGADRSLSSGWVTTIQNYATLGAPVYSLYAANGNNRHTFALSDAINPVGIRVQVEEDDATVNCRLALFDADWPEIEEYKFTVRIDERPTSYHTALGDVSDWWADMEIYQPAPVPESAYDPVYSSWYSFHQELSETAVEHNCDWSSKYGCRTLILDDGWQTDDNNKGYAYCGDWEIAESKFPDFKAHVARVKALGMKYLLWFSVPYVGDKSRAWQQFQDRVLTKPKRNADCLDPRFPLVRQFLIDCYSRAVDEWDMDGLKLDFVDQFTAVPQVSSKVEKADMVSVPAATDRLFTDIMAALRKIKPDVLIEFRQRYIGPAMRKYGNIFRAQDCPNDATSNRVRTLDIRLLAGNTAVHSDMVMWSRDESPERAALQLWATLFSVPQISVKADAVGKEHQAVIETYMEFWLSRKSLLMHGALTPLQPQNLYPVVIAEDANELLAALYQENFIITLPASEAKRRTLVNATSDDAVYVDFGNRQSSFHVSTYDCMGQLVSEEKAVPCSGIKQFNTPPSGYTILQ